MALWGLRGFFFLFPILLIFAVGQTVVSDPKGHVVLLVDAQTDPTRSENMRTALEAHLNSYDLSVMRVTLPNIPTTHTDLVADERLSPWLQNAFALVWFDATGETVLISVNADEGDGQTLKRSLPSDVSGGPDCNAVAAIVRSAISPWLEDPPVDKPQPLTLTAQVRDSEMPRAPLEPSIEISPIGTFYLLGGYTVVFIGGTAIMQHGFQFGLGAIAIKYLLLEIACDAFFPVQASPQPPTGEIELVRWPIRFSGGIIYSWRLGAVGVRGSLVLNMYSIENSKNGLFANDFDGLDLGFETSFFTRWYIIRGLLVNTSVGFSAFANTPRVEQQGDNIIESDRVQFQVAIGLILAFDIFR
ncbi:MAG: hypothetical protein QNJ97_01995 [Myxococcota bacterium]|nr:hypothetical protein [Myxococcota bacterium]